MYAPARNVSLLVENFIEAAENQPEFPPPKRAPGAGLLVADPEETGFALDVSQWALIRLLQGNGRSGIISI